VTAAPGANPAASRAVQVALAQLGKPYRWGHEGPSSYDCSGLVLYAWRAAGRSLPHSSRMQYASTQRVSISQLQPGDLVFFGRPIHHVGMYIGGGQMVEASRSGVPVRTRSIHRRDFVGAGRVR
jgi:cell wall-associated NlpC family hydrolase